MYEQYWNLTENPFQDGSDPRFYFPSQSHHAATLKLRYVVENRKGAGLLIGASGSGKTQVARQLERDLAEPFGPVIHLVFPQLEPEELLAYLAVELGASENAVAGPHAGLDCTVRRIEQQLRQFAVRKRQPVVVVDEAHLIDDVRVLQSLQLLLNFRERAEIEFSLILVGEHSLLSRVARVTQLDERIAVKSVLRPLSRDETSRYVRHRLQAAGRTQSVFDSRALEALFEISGGLPRRINRICDLALLVGYADQQTHISSAEIEAVSEELTAAVPD